MKRYFKILLALYCVAFAVCMACRLVLKLSYIDVATGFYFGENLLTAGFNLLLVLTAVSLFASNRLKKTDDDYPVDSQNRASAVLAVLTGASIIAFALVGAPASHLQQGYSKLFYQMRDYIGLGLGLLAGIAFLYVGIGDILGRKKAPAGLLVVIPAVWQIVLLIMRYNYYTTVISISDHLLIVLFMVFNTLFLMGMARTVCLQMRKDGRNYAIPSGLCASLCGFLLVLPNYVYMLVYAQPMPVALLGMFESACILMMSVYALFFVMGLMRSIKKV